MPIPKTKSELLIAIRDEYDKLTNELSGISSELSEVRELPGHAKNTLMSVKDK